MLTKEHALKIFHLNSKKGLLETDKKNLLTSSALYPVYQLSYAEASIICYYLSVSNDSKVEASRKEPCPLPRT